MAMASNDSRGIEDQDSRAELLVGVCVARATQAGRVRTNF